MRLSFYPQISSAGFDFFISYKTFRLVRSELEWKLTWGSRFICLSKSSGFSLRLPWEIWELISVEICAFFNFLKTFQGSTFFFIVTVQICREMCGFTFPILFRLDSSLWATIKLWCKITWQRMVGKKKKNHCRQRGNKKNCCITFSYIKLEGGGLLILLLRIPLGVKRDER